MWVCKWAMEWRSGREHERRTSVHEGKRYNHNKGLASERWSGQLGEWRLIRDWNDESNWRGLRRWRDGGYKWICREGVASVNSMFYYHSNVVLLFLRSLWCSLQAYGVHCEPTVFVKNTFQTISHCNLAKYSYPRLALLSSMHYPEEKVILDAARASVKRPQPTNIQIGDSLYFTNFKFFGVVTVSHILNNPISMEHKALHAHIE